MPLLSGPIIIKTPFSKPAVPKLSQLCSAFVWGNSIVYILLSFNFLKNQQFIIWCMMAGYDSI